MIRAITFASAGEPADVLEATEIPEPPTPGSGQIQVEVRAFPIHPGDLVGVSVGSTDPGRQTVAGLEATGVVVASGPGVDNPPVGTRVTVFPNPGSWAQRINVAAEVAVPVPDSVSDDAAVARKAARSAQPAGPDVRLRAPATLRCGRSSVWWPPPLSTLSIRPRCSPR
ncbi:alcohol dehydrogenase catalytic domain-containing protein [Mycobacterium sp.]|uniref:alcohol dehydrogenase catalytic domain-containing protein n=1 Tax=Mycobacterium sp. TaxID=1785 RepID=UPI0039C9B696